MNKKKVDERNKTLPVTFRDLALYWDIEAQELVAKIDIKGKIYTFKEVR